MINAEDHAGALIPTTPRATAHFHAGRLANQALDQVRRRTQQSTLGHRGRTPDPLYRIRRRLLSAHDRLRVGAFERLLVVLESGDPSGEVAAADLALELLREVYATTSRRCPKSPGALLRPLP